MQQTNHGHQEGAATAAAIYLAFYIMMMNLLLVQQNHLYPLQQEQKATKDATTLPE